MLSIYSKQLFQPNNVGHLTKLKFDLLSYELVTVLGNTGNFLGMKIMQKDEMDDDNFENVSQTDTRLMIPIENFHLPKVPHIQ